MKTYAFLIIFFLLVSCKNEEPRSEWATFDFAAFTVGAPSDWRKFSSQGYDSIVGGVTNGKDTLRYDYGMYSYRFTSETSATHVITESVRDGYQTKLVKPKTPGNGLIGIYYNLGNSLRLTIYGRSKNEDTVLQMLESVKIK